MATTKATELSQLSSALQVDESTGEIIFTGSLSVDSNTLFIDGDANRVGIGTLTPGSALDVAGDLTTTGGNISCGGFDFRLGGTDQVTRGDSGGSRALVKGPGAKLVVNFANDFTGGTEVNSDLFVDGNLNLGGSSTENYIAFRGTSGDGDGSYSFTYIGERIYDGGEGSELFLAKLNDTSGGSNPDRIRLSGSELHFQTYNDNIASGSFDSVANLNDFNTRMYIGSSGNVGIGTSSPSAKLDVSGSLRAAKYESTDNYPTIKPSLNLDFANTKSLDPRIDFTRASTATYYDGVTHAKAEENLLLYSQEFDNSAWSKVNSNIVANTATAPDGTVTAEEIIENNQDTYHWVERIQLSSAGVYTFSCHLKANTRDYGFLILRTNGNAKRICVTFDLLNGSVVDTVTQGSPNQESSTIEDVGNGWYRCSVTLEHDSSDNVIFLIGPHNDGTNTSVNAPYQGDGTSGIFIWGAQLEQRDTPAAYTATTDAPITNYIPVLKTASTNEPRFDHDPITGESLGLLIESQRTNLLTYSEDFSDSDWVKNYASITSNIVVAPDGTLTGDKLVEDTSSSAHFTKHPIVTFSSGTTYIFSFFAKSAERTKVQIVTPISIFGTLGFTDFDLSNGSTSGLGVITDVGNGWFRCSVSRTATVDAFDGLQIRLLDDSGNNDYQGDGYSGIYVWGAQLEES